MVRKNVIGNDVRSTKVLDEAYVVVIDDDICDR